MANPTHCPRKAQQQHFAANRASQICQLQMSSATNLAPIDRYNILAAAVDKAFLICKATAHA